MEDLDLDFLHFIKRVKETAGIDLALYKEAQMKRRLTTLRLKKGYLTFAAFFEAMMKDRELYYEFLDRMTINVSEFWRNPNRWQVVEQTLIPDLLRRNRRLKCWSAACSTGEEPYTLAMILAGLNALGDARIIATDIDDGALEKARKGVYIDRAVRDVPQRYINQFFVENHGTFSIVDALKNAVTFKKGNLLLDPFEGDFDLIICRNVLIYFTEEAKINLFHKFARALRPGGVLFVGSTEQIFSPGNYGLEQADTFFYRKKIQ